MFLLIFTNIFKKIKNKKLGNVNTIPKGSSGSLNY